MRERLPQVGEIWSLYKMGGITPALSSLLGGQNAQQIAFIRQLMREQRKTSLFHTPLLELEFTVFDLETTGFAAQHKDEIISFGAVQLTGGQLHEEHTFYSLVQPKRKIPAKIEKLTGITNEMAEAAPNIVDVLQQFFKFVQRRVLIAHGSGHDKRFLEAALRRTSRIHLTYRLLDTMMIGKWLKPHWIDHSLDHWLDYYGIQAEQRHHSLADAIMTAKLWANMLEEIYERQIVTLGDLYTYLST